jgi:hypothetical protein
MPLEERLIERSGPSPTPRRSFSSYVSGLLFAKTALSD